MSSSAGSQTSKLMQIRKGILWFAVIGTILIGIRHIMPGEAGSGGSFDAFCPFGAIETFWVYVTRGQTLKTTNLLNFAILSGVLAVSLTAGRAFCGWMCPLGAVQEGLAHLAHRVGGEKRYIRGKPAASRLPITIPRWADKPLRWAKYLILGLVLIASTFAVYPPLHAICPVRAVFSLRLETALLLSVLVTFLLTSFFVERAWCKYLCPLGAVLVIFNKISPVRMVSSLEHCNHCGRCDVECSMGIQAVPENLSDTECIRCLECLETCARDGSLELKVL